VTGFVEPATGRTVWNIANAVCKEMFELILVDFAKSVGAGTDKRIVLQLDNAGWHGPNAVPDGIRLVYQPAHSLELQPAEHLWAFVDEPLANRCFATIESLGPWSDNVAGHSHSSSTPSATAPSSTGGLASQPGRNQPESVLLGQEAEHRFG
jgi:DDE superfamily endonuclease